MDLGLGTLFHQVHAFHQGEVDAFDDGSVNVIFCVQGCKARDGTLCKRAGNTGFPIGLHNESVATCGNVSQCFVEVFFGRNALFCGKSCFFLREISNKPTKHGIAEENLNFGVPCVIQHCGVGGQKLLGFKIFFGCKLHGGTCAEG